MKKAMVVHHDDALGDAAFRCALCGGLMGYLGLQKRIVRGWAKVTCKRCLRMAPKAVKVRLGLT